MKNNLLVLILSFLIGSIKAQYSTPSTVNTEDSVWVDQDSIFNIRRGQKAHFKGGESAFQKYITKNFKYPIRCQDKGISGSVVLRFVVEMDGSISNVRVIEGTAKCPEFAQEAVRVLKKSPRWIPGIYNGQYVKSYRELPLRLSLE